jgi:hypothetical protein
MVEHPSMTGSRISRSVWSAGYSPAFERRTKAGGCLHLTRISGNAEAPPARSVNPVRGGLFIVTEPQNISQTPLGVTCGLVRAGRVKGMSHRSPLTGFGDMIAGVGYYKQATPNGVMGEHPWESKDACKVQGGYPALQTLRDFGNRGASSLPAWATPPCLGCHPGMDLR